MPQRIWAIAGLVSDTSSPFESSRLGARFHIALALLLQREHGRWTLRSSAVGTQHLDPSAQLSHKQPRFSQKSEMHLVTSCPFLLNVKQVSA